MNKTYNNPFQFKKFISFSFVAFVACCAGICFQESTSAQAFCAAGGASNQIMSTNNGEINSCYLTQAGSFLISGSGILPVQQNITNKIDSNVDSGQLSGVTVAGCLASSNNSLVQKENRPLVGRADDTPLLSGVTCYFRAGSLDGAGTVDLGGDTMKVSAIQLADGSKISNGTICLDNDFVVEKEIKQELQFLEVIPDQNGAFDLGGGTYRFSTLKFNNGEGIVNGTIVIDASFPESQVICELPASEQN